ncbi:hypothetical protein Tco_0753223 [Tanacetum coccineum]
MRPLAMNVLEPRRGSSIPIDLFMAFALTSQTMVRQIITFAAMARQIIAFAAMVRQIITFAAMARQIIAFAAMAGQIITFASMPATNVWVVDDYQTRASICRHIFMFLASACRCFAVVKCQAYRHGCRILFLRIKSVIKALMNNASKVSWRAMAKGEIYVECDSVVVCELLLGLRPWHLKSDYWYTIVCDCVGWCRCDEAGLAMMSLLVGRNRDKAICILAWQLTKVAAMAYVFFSSGVFGYRLSTAVAVAKQGCTSSMEAFSLYIGTNGLEPKVLEWSSGQGCEVVAKLTRSDSWELWTSL